MNINIVTSVKNFFSTNPEIDIVVDDSGDGSKLGDKDNNIVPEIKFEEQVYHIPGNTYTYDDAKAVCKAYGNRLANYKEVKSALDGGADWCSYGWSDDLISFVSNTI